MAFSSYCLPYIIFRTVDLLQSDHLQLDWLQNGQNETQTHYKHYSACHFFPDLMHICCNVLLPLRVSGLKLIPIDNLVYTPKTFFTTPRFTDLVRNMPLKASPHKSTDYYPPNVLQCCSVNKRWKSKSFAHTGHFAAENRVSFWAHLSKLDGGLLCVASGCLLSVWVCETHVVHHFNSTRLLCTTDLCYAHKNLYSTLNTTVFG